jgi:hypothetical protein
LTLIFALDTLEHPRKCMFGPAGSPAHHRKQDQGLSSRQALAAGKDRYPQSASGSSSTEMMCELPSEDTQLMRQTFSENTI